MASSLPLPLPLPLPSSFLNSLTSANYATKELVEAASYRACIYKCGNFKFVAPKGTEIKSSKMRAARAARSYFYSFNQSNSRHVALSLPLQQSFQKLSYRELKQRRR